MSEPRGTRVLMGSDCKDFRELTRKLEDTCLDYNLEQVIIPSIWTQDTFVEKAGEEILNQMYTFKDKKGRDLCLIPEGTAPIQELFQEWSKTLSKDKYKSIFYLSRCYRYERPQAGRYREFWQFGVEFLYKDISTETELEIKDKMYSLLQDLLNMPNDNLTLNNQVKRGLSYYIEDGFEVSCDLLGAQKQILGGGKYQNGIGFAIGVDRLLLANNLIKALEQS